MPVKVVALGGGTAYADSRGPDTKAWRATFSNSTLNHSLAKPQFYVGLDVVSENLK